jgi:hypothetical protein
MEEMALRFSIGLVYIIPEVDDDVIIEVLDTSM